MMVSEKGSSLDFTRVMTLNESAAYLIEKTGVEPFSIEKWTELLMDKYDVDKEVAERDVKTLVDKLVDAGIVEQN